MDPVERSGIARLLGPTEDIVMCYSLYVLLSLISPPPLPALRYKADPSNPGEFLKDSQGKHVPESNSRITTWSDGSKTLTVGSEHFELIDHPTPTNYLMVTQQDATQTILEGVSQVSTKVRHSHPIFTRHSSKLTLPL